MGGNNGYTRPDPEPAAELFDVEHAMALMVEGAVGALRWLRDPARARSKEHHAELGRMVKDALLTCRALSQPPPIELVELIALMLAVEMYPRHPHRKEWRAAARHLAAHPHASNREVAKVAGVDDKTVAAWKNEPEFQTRIRAEKLLARQSK